MEFLMVGKHLIKAQNHPVPANEFLVVHAFVLLLERDADVVRVAQLQSPLSISSTLPLRKGQYFHFSQRQ